MGKNWWKYIVVFALLFLAAKPLFAAEEEVLPIVEMRPDRVVIYPQRMELNGEETLFDMLQLYPDLLTNAYDNWLANYEIRIDNGPYGGDIRVLLNEMKASRIMMIQISDNPGVAKGISGTMGVVDVFLLPLETGVHGTIGAELSQDVSTTPFAEFRYGSEKTDILANASYNFAPRKPYDFHNQYSNFHMVNRLGEKDQLVTYFTQSYERTHDMEKVPVGVNYMRYDDRTFYGQLRNYHYFRPERFLMSAVVYYYGRYPEVVTSFPNDKTIDSISDGKTHIIAAVEEYNATFFDKLNLMAGLEADYVIDNEHYFYPEKQIPALEDYLERSFNADLYVELDYTFRNWRFTAGDRVRYQRYFNRIETYPDPTVTLVQTPLNMMHASVIYTPHREHQVQAAYAQKFFTPNFAVPDYEISYLNEVKLAYNFARPNVSVGLNAYYYNSRYGINRYDDFLINASARYHYRFLTVTGGVNVCIYDNLDEPRLVSAAFKLAPIFDIPYGMQLKARAVFYTPSSSLRRYSLATMPFKGECLYYYDQYINRPVYGELQFTKFWPMVDVYALWHDIFNGSYGIATLGLRVKM